VLIREARAIRSRQLAEEYLIYYPEGPAAAEARRLRDEPARE
jgi:hypothetical protein